MVTNTSSLLTRWLGTGAWLSSEVEAHDGSIVIDTYERAAAHFRVFDFCACIFFGVKL